MLLRIAKIGFCAAWILSAAYAIEGMAASLEAIIDTQVETDQAAAKSQRRIDALSEESAKLLAEYRQVTAQLDSLRAYNRQLEKLIRSQKEEFTSLQQQLGDVEVTHREIVPLLLRMVSALEQFVALDIPFLPQERRARVQQIKALMDRADMGLSEKYRRVLEAFQVEVEYGRTIEAYRGTLELEMDNTSRTVDFFRVGRAALFFHTLDGKACGHWDIQAQNWAVLPARYCSAVAQGLGIARKQAPPDLLLLPIRAPEAAQ